LNVQYECGRSFDVPVSILDVTLAGTILGWSPRLSFQDGIGRTLQDLRGNVALSVLD
jgi:UDP-glucose 4-epimerase